MLLNARVRKKCTVCPLFLDLISQLFQSDMATNKHSIMLPIILHHLFVVDACCKLFHMYARSEVVVSQVGFY